ncbi:MAG: peptidase family C69 [Desulfobacteraceae bacterium]|jgi:dipeptidase|nr:MAG: peptidase family C69 [Desulfobacteraceae bacterium]
MCDTMVIRHQDAVYFAKNSDREPGEAQLVVRIPAESPEPGQRLKTTYIDIDQAPRRNGLMLSKPFWIWGAEMGANEHGVVIGNEAVFTRLVDDAEGLIGMDLLRLGLERGNSADEALQVITDLLELHGQGGPCGYRDKRLRYDNSFIIADARRIWVLETAGRHWVAKKVGTFASISNCLTIGTDYDICSEGLENFALKKGLHSGGGRLDFKKTFDTRLVPYFAGSAGRLSASVACLRRFAGQDVINVAHMMEMLRSHSPGHTEPRNGSNGDVCMHAGGFIRRSQTCGSMVSKLSKDNAIHFFTGTSAPCISVFRPVSFDMDTDFSVLNPDGETVDGSVWRRHEHVHRRVLFNEEARLRLRQFVHETETRMLAQLNGANSAATLENLIAADQITVEAQDQWCREFGRLPLNYPLLHPYGIYWKRMNRLDGFE